MGHFPELSQKVALVTGATGGIGRGIALRLAREGAQVVCHYRSDPAAAQALVHEIETSGGKAVALQADIGNVASVRSLFDELDKIHGRLDILVNNAGAFAITAVADTDEATFDTIYALNVKGPFFAAQLAAARMGRGGRIIHISSTTSRYPNPNTAVYASSKAAIKLLTEIHAKEVGGRGITVNSVLPGPVSPGMFDRVPADLQQYAMSRSPFGRLGTPDDIAGVVVFLASEDSGWITGQEIVVNGGADL